MNKLQELIGNLCPNGVRYKKLSELCISLKKGTLKTTDLKENGKYPVINSGRELYGFYDEFNNKNAITFAARGEYAGYISYFKDEFWAGGLCYPYSSKDENIITNKFLYYYLKSKENIIMEKLVARGGIPALNKVDLDRFMVAVPPLDVQCEIVHILDAITLLSAELRSELEARKKQFNYYRDELIKKAPGAEYKTLGEISTEMYRGAGIKRDEVTPSGIPCVRYGEIYTTYNVLFDTCVSHTNEEKQKSKKFFGYGDVLFAITGESVEEIGKSTVYLGTDKCLAGGDIVVMKHEQNPKYIAYALSTTEAQFQKSKGKVKSKVVHTSVPALKEISIPIPSLEEQERIANLIEKFDIICNDMISGIPAEIEKREKQYEYYRDKLMIFKEVEVSE